MVFECFLRGLLKKEGTEILVGDWVELDNVEESNKTARIVNVLPRQNDLTRPKIANVDQVFIVHPYQEPVFSPYQLDRYLTHVELAGLTPVVCISKCDLAAQPSDLEEIQALYQDRLHYPVLFTSVHRPETLAPFRDAAREKVSVLAGLSGAGKSSLLNALKPVLSLKVQEVSEKLSRGQHTTRHVELIEMEQGMYVADTPGFSNLKFNYVMPEEIEAIYRDFEPFREDCEYSNCLHVDEPGCAVLAHLEEISQTRYESYREVLLEAQAYHEEMKSQSQKNEYGKKTLHRKGKDDLQIVRLKEKAREASRRTMKQALPGYFDEETQEPL